jgi:hypothetical protein
MAEAPFAPFCLLSAGLPSGGLLAPAICTFAALRHEVRTGKVRHGVFPVFKFIFGGKSNTPEVTIETDRARYARLIEELNEMIDGLGVKPRVTIDPATGHILPDTPEQFADEALALPAPEASEPAAESEAEASGDAPTPKA